MSERLDQTTLRHHLRDDILPWWLTHGPDTEHGGVLTCWDNTGTRLVSTDKYTWSQGRWTWLTARVALAAKQGILDIDGDRYARESERTARFVAEHAVLPDGTAAYVTTRTGEPFEPVPGEGLSTSVFADLFVALGYAGLAQLDPSSGWGSAALEILRRSAATIEAGTFRSEPYPIAAGHLSFGLPMILVGVGEQVYRATASAEAAAVVQSAVGQIETHFLDGDDIAEMPRMDGAKEDSLLVRHRTPGHVLEALWFLHHARDLIPSSSLADPARLAAIATHSLEIGWDHEHGGLFRYVDADGGRPSGARAEGRYEDLIVDTWDTKLWWPHAEALYTTRLLATETGDPAMAAWARRVHDYTLATFPEGPGREWTQNRDRAGRPIEKTVALPVKDPFHVARALLMGVELEHQRSHRRPVAAPEEDT